MPISHAYSYETYGRKVVRNELSYSGGKWVDDDRLTYKWDSLERQEYEEREDNTSSFPPVWTSRYDVNQEYDKNGNRTRLHRNTLSGYEADYGNPEDLSYTFNVVNQMSAISDADDANYTCTVTCDANNNITAMAEGQNGPYTASVLLTDYTYDDLNRLTQHKTVAYDYGQGDHEETQRNHTIDALGRTAATNYKQYWQDDSGIFFQAKCPD